MFSRPAWRWGVSRCSLRLTAEGTSLLICVMLFATVCRRSSTVASKTRRNVTTEVISYTVVFTVLQFFSRQAWEAVVPPAVTIEIFEVERLGYKASHSFAVFSGVWLAVIARRHAYSRCNCHCLETMHQEFQQCSMYQ